MGQLIKLQDYVSRYEQDIFLYPSRFVRLKTQQWDKLKNAWENGEIPLEREEEPLVPEWYEEEKEPFFNRIKGFLKREKEVEKEVLEEQETPASSFSFTPTLAIQPDTLDDLKRSFLEQLFTFQLKWASTTLAEQSFVSKSYYHNERLKYFLQRFPDTVLVLFHPIFLLKTAPVEVEIILITPTDVWCITFLEEEERAVFVGSNDHFWIKRNQEQEHKVLNPLLALNRTEKVTKNILGRYGIELPIHKVVLTRNGYIDYPSAPYDTKFIERRNYEKWFQTMRTQRSPLKHIQLKAAQALLNYCQTTSVRRPEWEIESEQE
ncbi:nuclease-related domain-containing protein [Robertmurraya sp. DFI.2.37]|uniref:nuclease-related domain-containing protein n=1 Tax=Robertmurraya sp. DFI.2.37 TaxID=3031819 RepID=UPI00124722E5|nr:nuclease-related domain-containing protein [Robertmurraya sp. DFI.2.37]MDF1508676.1 nuclease-related domain-containing protein [Robertmurraya sp. DFI.2.37]